MPRFEPSVLTEMPTTGRVLIAHPSRGWQARDVAREQLVDILYSELAPPTHVYVVNVDQIVAPPLHAPGWTL